MLRAFGPLLLGLLLLVAGVTGAAADALKTVTIGSPKMVRTMHGAKMQARLAVADRVLVQVRPGVDAQKLAGVLGKAQSGRVRSLGHRIYALDLPANSDVLKMAGDLRMDPAVAVAEPDLLMYPALVPNDTRYADQWHHPIIQSPAGWEVATGSSSVVIAVIDSGVYMDHPDFSGKIWRNPGETAGNGRDDDGNGYIDDLNGWDFYSNNANPNPSPDGQDDDYNGEADEQVNHGTLVAGLAGALGNDSYGTAGMAWGCKIMPLQVFPDDGGTAVSTVIEAINYAVDKGADVINMSIGGDYTELFTAPLVAAYEAGCVVVVAGGNSGAELTDAPSTWESPVCNDGTNVWASNCVIGVGATDRYDRKSSYSNFDSSTAHFIDVMAPGDALFGPAAYFPTVSGFNQYFQTNSGTSFSSPLVAGLAALIVSQNPTWTPAQVIERVRSCGDNIDSLNAGYSGRLGGGRINVARALGVTLAPAAARDLAAADTSGDDGGSITVTWQTSPDDGAGSNTVTAYKVYRRTGASGSFTVLKSLPPGSEGYVDNAVTDGTDYYYKVRVTDGTRWTDTSLVGPAQSLNDSPPATVAGLGVSDRPDDSGGAIVLTWSAYTAPADFASFRVYRSTTAFESVASLTPIATITSSSTVEYVDTAVTDGVSYYYAIGVRDTLGNENRSLTGIGPVQSYSNTDITFAAGLHFMGAPAVPADGDPATFFGLPAGSFGYCRWTPSSGAYLYDSLSRPVPETLQMKLGRGFWVKLPQATTVSPDGLSAPAGDFEIDLTPGWHQLANPFFTTIDFSEATVTYSGATMDLTSADGAGVMAAFAWTYNNTAQVYELAYPAVGSEAKLIQPWQGFWVLARKACTLTLSRPLGVSSAASGTMRTQAVRRTARPWQVEWSVPLQIGSAAGPDAACYVGTASKQVLLAKPPPATGAPVLSVSSPGTQGSGRYGVALAQTSTNDIIWNLKIENLKAGQAVTLKAADLSHLPKGATAILKDLAGGQSVYLRTVGRYSFTPREGETTRSLQLTVSTQRTGQLMLQGVTAQSLRGGGAQVTLNLSSAAAVDVTIMNMAGRVVRLVEEGKTRPAGNNVVLWDGRTELGTRAPAGQYLAQVTARSESGESVKAISPLKVTP
ncbi:MAG: S8 family serine peptidase [Armatimonadia bacterium]